MAASTPGRTRPRRLPFAALAITCAGLAVSCSGGGDEAIIYSGRTESLIGPLLEDFAESTDRDVAVRYGQSSDLALLIDEEGDDTLADVFLAQNPGAVGFLDEAGRLRPLDEDLVALAGDTEEVADDRTWIGVSGRVRVLVYNTEELDEADLPTSVLDLTGDEWAERVALAPANGSFIDFVSAMRAELGDDVARDWLDGMAANDAPTYANNTAIVEAVARGEVEMGLVNHYYAYRFLDEDPDAPIANHLFPADDIGSLLIVTAVAEPVAGDQELGDELIEFLLSEPAQRFLTDETFEYPLTAGVEPAEVLPPLDLSEVYNIDLGALGGDLEGTIAMIEESGVSS